MKSLHHADTRPENENKHRRTLTRTVTASNTLSELQLCNNYTGMGQWPEVHPKSAWGQEEREGGLPVLCWWRQEFVCISHHHQCLALFPPTKFPAELDGPPLSPTSPEVLQCWASSSGVPSLFCSRPAFMKMQRSGQKSLALELPSTLM